MAPYIIVSLKKCLIIYILLPEKSKGNIINWQESTMSIGMIICRQPINKL